MTKGEETRLQNLEAKTKAMKLTRLDKLHLKRLRLKKQAESQQAESRAAIVDGG